MSRTKAALLFWLVALSAFSAFGARILYARPVPYPVATGCVLATLLVAGILLAIGDVLEKRNDAEERERAADAEMLGQVGRNLEER